MPSKTKRPFTYVCTTNPTLSVTVQAKTLSDAAHLARTEVKALFPNYPQCRVTTFHDARGLFVYPDGKALHGQHIAELRHDPTAAARAVLDKHLEVHQYGSREALGSLNANPPDIRVNPAGKIASDGSCNACTARVEPITVIHLRGIEIRLCPRCRGELAGQLSSKPVAPIALLDEHARYLRAAWLNPKAHAQQLWVNRFEREHSDELDPILRRWQDMPFPE